MNFGELLARYYEIVGDRKVSPRLYPLERTKTLLNAGFREFRLRVQDKWIETNLSLTAGQGIYELPDDTVRVERIAYEDRTLEPSTVLELMSENHRWQEQISNRPRNWTTEDVAHNEFRLYPKPTDSSAIAVTMSSEAGLLLNVVNQSGANVPFNQEHGFLLQAPGATLSPEAGVTVRVTSTGAAQLTLWLVPGISDLSGDEELVPIPDAYALAPLYWSLAETYSELEDHWNPQLMEYYKARFESEVDMARKAFSGLLAYMLMGIGSDQVWGTSGDTTLPSEVTNLGNPTTVTWARHIGQDDGDGYYDF